MSPDVDNNLWVINCSLNISSSVVTVNTTVWAMAPSCIKKPYIFPSVNYPNGTTIHSTLTATNCFFKIYGQWDFMHNQSTPNYDHAVLEMSFMHYRVIFLTWIRVICAVCIPTSYELHSIQLKHKFAHFLAVQHWNHSRFSHYSVYSVSYAAPFTWNVFTTLAYPQEVLQINNLCLNEHTSHACWNHEQWKITRHLSQQFRYQQQSQNTHLGSSPVFRDITNFPV